MDRGYSEHRQRASNAGRSPTEQRGAHPIGEQRARIPACWGSPAPTPSSLQQQARGSSQRTNQPSPPLCFNSPPGKDIHFHVTHSSSEQDPAVGAEGVFLAPQFPACPAILAHQATWGDRDQVGFQKAELSVLESGKVPGKPGQDDDPKANPTSGHPTRDDLALPSVIGSGSCSTPPGQESASDPCKPRSARKVLIPGQGCLQAGCRRQARPAPACARLLQAAKDRETLTFFLRFQDALNCASEECTEPQRPPDASTLADAFGDVDRLRSRTHGPHSSSAVTSSSPHSSRPACSLPSGFAFSGREVTVDEGSIFAYFRGLLFTPRPELLKLEVGNVPPSYSGLWSVRFS